MYTTPPEVELTVVDGGRLRPGIDPTSNRALFDVLDEDDDSIAVLREGTQA